MSLKRNIILITFLFYCSDLMAEQQLPPISISASRTEIPATEVAGALTVLTKQQIENFHAVHVSEVLQAVPGLNVSTQGSAGNLTQIRIRGAEANQVLVIIDGIEVNDPASSSEFNFAHLTADSIERIEVLRGPQSALWGSDALAGVINITTKKADRNKQLIVKNSYGSENTYQGGITVFTRSDKYNLSISGNFIDTDGFNIATTGQERDGYENATLNIKTGYQLNEKISFGASSRYTNASNEFDPALGTPVDGFGEIDVEQFYSRIFSEIKTFGGAWNHLLEVSLVDTSNDTIDGFFGRSKTEATKAKYAYQSTLNLPSFDSLPVKQSLTFAVEREQERFKQQGTSFPGFDPNQRQRITNYGKVAEYRAKILENWALSASFRHDDNDEFDNQETYNIGINYVHPETNSKAYITHATGAKNPTFTELFGFAPNSFIGNPDLEAETSEAWEIGVSQQFLENRLTIDTAIFKEDLKDEIQTLFEFDPASMSFLSRPDNNDSRSQRKGVEISITSIISEALSANSSFTYLDTSEPDASGNDRTEIRRPSQQWSGQVNYSFLSNKANLNVNIDYIGDRKDIDFGTGNRVTLDDYTLINVAFNYQFNDKVKFFAKMNNIFDEEYQDVFGYETNEFSGFAGFELTL